MATYKNAVVMAVRSSSALDTVSLRLSTPDGPEARTIGTFFALLKIDEIPSLVPWVDPIMQFLEQTYIQSIRLDPVASAERALGVTRQKLKLKLQQIIQESRLINLNNIHYVLGVLKGKNLLLTHFGGVRAMVLHERKIPNSPQTHVHWINLIEVPLKKTGRSTAEAETAQSIVSGSIGAPDTVVIATESLFDNLSLSKIEQMVSAPTLENTERLLEKNLSQATTRFNHGVIILRLAPALSPLKAREQVTESMTTLVNKEANTKSMLVSWGPSLWHTLKNIPAAVSSIKLRPSMPRAEGPIEERLGRNIGAGSKQLFVSLWRLLIWLILAPIHLIKAVGTATGRKRVSFSFKNSLPTAAESIASRLSSWPRSTQKLLMISLFLAYLFAQSLVFLAEKRAEDTTSAAVLAEAGKIQQLLDEAEADLIYGNDEQGVKLIAEVVSLLQIFPQDTDTDKQRWQILNEKVSALKSRAAHEVTISNPTVIADLGGTEIKSIDGLFWQSAATLLAYG